MRISLYNNVYGLYFVCDTGKVRRSTNILWTSSSEDLTYEAPHGHTRITYLTRVQYINIFNLFVFHLYIIKSIILMRG